MYPPGARFTGMVPATLRLSSVFPSVILATGALSLDSSAAEDNATSGRSLNQRRTCLGASFTIPSTAGSAFTRCVCIAAATETSEAAANETRRAERTDTGKLLYEVVRGMNLAERGVLFTP